MRCSPSPWANQLSTDVEVTLEVAQQGDFIAALASSAAQTVPTVAADGSAMVTVTIPANTRAVTLTASTTDDDTDEANGRLSVTLQSAPASYVFNPARAQVTVLDNDGPTVDIAAAAAAEGNPLLFTVTLSATVSRNRSPYSYSTTRP